MLNTNLIAATLFMYSPHFEEKKKLQDFMDKDETFGLNLL